MTEYKSDQVTNEDAVPRVLNDTTVSRGRVRRMAFTYTVPAGNIAVDDTVVLCRVPAGARIYGGVVAFEAMSTAGGTAQIQIGDGTTAAKYLGTTSVDAAGKSAFGDTVALSFMEKLGGELTLTATVKGEAWAATKKLNGFIEYMLD